MKDDRTILIEEIVRRLDRYMFNFDAAICALNGDTLVRPEEDDTTCTPNDPLGTQRQRTALRLAGDIEDEINRALPQDKQHLVGRLDNAHLEYVMASEDVARLLGLIMGLRLAGMSSSDAKKMAATWKWSTGISEGRDAEVQPGETSHAH